MSTTRTTEETIILKRTDTEYVFGDGDGQVYARKARPAASDDDLRDWVYEALGDVADDLLDGMYEGEGDDE